MRPCLLCSSKKSAVDSKKCWGWDLFHLKRPLVGGRAREGPAGQTVSVPRVRNKNDVLGFGSGCKIVKAYFFPVRPPRGLGGLTGEK
jgi:hypothetical protein